MIARIDEFVIALGFVVVFLGLLVLSIPWMLALPYDAIVGEYERMFDRAQRMPVRRWLDNWAYRV